MSLSPILTSGSYVVLVFLWGLIFVLYLRRRRELERSDPLVAGLLVVLLADAAKNVLESAYFGTLWGARLGHLPAWIGAPLENPAVMVMPKLINVGVAIFVLTRVVRGFFPDELAAREQRRKERARLEEELRQSLELVQESEGRLTSLLARTSDVVAFWRVVNNELSLESINDAGKATLGFGDEAIGTSWRDIAPPALQTLLDAAWKSGTAQREEDGYLDTTKGRLAVIRQVVPLPDDDGVVRRLASFTQDVTMLRERQANDEASERLESLGMLASGIAHDFNNLLAVLRADIDNARQCRVDPGRINPQQDDSLTALEHADVTIDRAKEFVTQLLAMAGKRAPVSGAVDLGAVADDTARLLRPAMAEGMSLDITVEQAPLPVVMGDRTQLQQICLNLIKNGLDAAAAHQAKGHVRVHVSVHDDEHVVLRVEDDGPGIDAVVQRRIFEPFFTTKRGGRGLGLATVFGLTRAHGGSVDVASAPGQGAVFTVRLPYQRGVAPKLITPKDAKVIAPKEAQGLSILLIDDDDRVRRATRRLLERLGHRVIDKHSGAAALECDDQFDAVVTDVTMPELDGPTTLMRLRERHGPLPAVIVTGRGDIAVGNDVVLSKPFDQDALQVALQDALVRAKTDT